MKTTHPLQYVCTTSPAQICEIPQPPRNDLRYQLTLLTLVKTFSKASDILRRASDFLVMHEEIPCHDNGDPFLRLHKQQIRVPNFGTMKCFIAQKFSHSLPLPLRSQSKLVPQLERLPFPPSCTDFAIIYPD